MAAWRTPVLLRSIPGSTWQDALGCYPLSVIDPHADLEAGLAELRELGLVSVALVPDPLLGPSVSQLSAAFEVCRPFKTHFVIDREASPVCFARTHRRMIRKARKDCTFGPVALREVMGEWERLYAHTIQRHQVTGLQKFNPGYFRALAEMPEIVALAARKNDEIIAMILWVQSGGIAYAHLEGSSVAGYKTQAIYGIFDEANRYFADCRFLHFGGTAGLAGGAADGLAYFKRGFANREVTAYFCGSRLSPERYATLAGGRTESTFFPAYREP